MRKYLSAYCLILFLAGCATVPSVVVTPVSSSSTGTHVRLMRGLDGAPLSPGVDEIAAMAAKIPGVTLVKVYEYTNTQQIADEINAEPATVREVIGGYSCGANASPVAAVGISRSIDMVTVIQASLWCGGTPLTANVKAAQETYNPDCVQTAGLGCKLLDLGPGFNPSDFTVISRPDCHPCADVDPDAQADMISAIKSVTNSSAKLALHKAQGKRIPGAINVIVRYHGERAY